MKGFELYNGNHDIRVVDGSRVVFTTEGALINLLPPSNDINMTFNVVFPDFTKDYFYSWKHLFSYTSLGNQVGYDSSCSTQLTIPPQNFADEINLLSAPTDTNIFVGSVVITRTDAPSHTWNGATISPKQPMNVKIPFISGSLLIEAELNMSRAFSIYVSGGNLKLHRQQSVGPAPGGWGAFGNSFNWVSPGAGGGGENVYGAEAGLGVLQVDLVNVPSFTASGGIFAPDYDDRTRRGGPNACAIPNPADYDYGSTYQVNLTGAFGRRS